ncbi:MAG: hypothetical protein LOX97_09345 [Sphingomonas sp.]|nr:hypothetical protein [Sphingomonas sp.]
MIRYIIATTAGLLALAACSTEPETIGGESTDPMADELASAPPVELPPAIASSKTYRCKDNSLVQIDWLANDKGAYVHGEGQTQTHLKPAEPVEGEVAGSDLTAEGGYVLKGTATASTVTLTLPGKPAQSCKG